MFAKKEKAAQQEFWIAAQPLQKCAKSTFYANLDETLESFGFGAKVVVQVEVHRGDHADHQEMSTRILEAQQTINKARAVDVNTLSVRTVTADKGYYALSELEAIQQERIKTIIADPINNRRLDKLPAERRQTVKAALRSVKSKYGQELLRRRGMHIFPTRFLTSASGSCKRGFSTGC